MRPDWKHEDPALGAMTLDVLSDVLGMAEHPAEMGDHLTEEMRELTGARCVVFIECPDNDAESSHRVVGVHPPRRRAWAESPAAQSLYDAVHRQPDTHLWREDDPSEAARFLRQEGFGLSLAAPLHMGDLRQGAMLLLGLPDKRHLVSVTSMLEQLSPAVALVLRNAILYENQEQTIRDRTARLQEANQQLRLELAERRRAEETLCGREQQIASLLETSEASRRALLGILEDQKRAEEELARHRDHLEELVEERTLALEESRAELRRAERLASIGTLAAGIAHEINNPLGMLMLRADMALKSLGNPEALGEMLRKNKQDVERCHHIVKGVLDFARQRSTVRGPLDVNNVVGNSLDFTREYARMHGVAVESHLADKLGRVLGNSTELEQVVVNLVHNAVQACGAGGRVTVETRAADGMVRLVVRDNGCGMSPQQIEHAFDPFFTTRLEKGGTGLGLSTVHGIITSHGGTIAIDSEKGRGSVFTIELPWAQGG